MKISAIALLGLGLAAAAPLSAQIGADTRNRTRIPGIPFPIPSDERADTRTGARVEDADRGRRGPSKVPRGHLPPPGSCRVWIDGVPPGQQPRVTDCATAQAERLRYGVGARVIHGDRESFPGRAKGKFDRRDRDDDDRRDDDRWGDDDERRGKPAARERGKGQGGTGKPGRRGA